MTDQPDPLEVLAFVESGMSMTSEQIAARWPEWHAKAAEARQRYDSESRAFRLKWQTTRGGSSDPMVSSQQEAVFHWVHLPLIRAALGRPLEMEIPE